MRVPSALNAAAERSAGRRRAIRLPVRRSRMRAVPSSLAVTIRIPSGLNAAPYASRHDRAGHAGRPVRMSQTRARPVVTRGDDARPVGTEGSLVDAAAVPSQTAEDAAGAAIPDERRSGLGARRRSAGHAGLNATLGATRPSRAARGGCRRRGRPRRVPSRRRLPSRRAPPRAERGTRDRRSVATQHLEALPAGRVPDPPRPVVACRDGDRSSGLKAALRIASVCPAGRGGGCGRCARPRSAPCRRRRR